MRVHRLLTRFLPRKGLPMTAFRGPQVAILLTLLTVSALPVAADSVQLANGDVLNGRVLGLDDKQLRLESATLGQVSIPRVKVVSITLGDQKPAAPGTPKAGARLTAEAAL